LPINVEMIRSKEGATRVPHEACLTKALDPVVVGWANFDPLSGVSLGGFRRVAEEAPNA